MRLFSSLVFTFLSLSSLSLATPLDTQLVLPDQGIADKPRWSYVSCGDEDDVVEIESIKVSPDPPKPGQNLTVEVKATTNKVIQEGAYADVTVKLGLIKILTKQFDLCEEARNANASVQCPVSPGPYQVQHTVALPKEIPPAKFKINVEGYSDEDERLFCLNLEADFTPRFPHRFVNFVN